jgi:hypothetical protein
MLLLIKIVSIFKLKCNSFPRIETKSNPPQMASALTRQPPVPGSEGHAAAGGKEGGAPCSFAEYSSASRAG